jgi:hypothetical protein
MMSENHQLVSAIAQKLCSRAAIPGAERTLELGNFLAVSRFCSALAGDNKIVGKFDTFADICAGSLR